uniref:Uncharacterized protein n=1 Tax=Molossus molossus TaxID=27622 RepID=A0A7J8HJ42_MOLMO|nr:hypothetical protein HJG59_011060 [Molossus molossus]
MGSSGILRVVITKSHRQACVTTAGTGVRQWCVVVVFLWGGGLSPGEKIQSRAWGGSQSPVPGSLIVPCATSHSHHVGLPLQGQQPWSCDSPGLLSSILPEAVPRFFPVSLCLFLIFHVSFVK